MQTIQSQQNPACQRLSAAMAGRIVEKVFRDREGNLIRARFYVYESAGRIKARLIDFVYVAEQALLNAGVFVLNGYRQTKAVFSKILKQKIISHFEIREILFFNGSKPRAPTLV